jgi:hypothetical protein
MSEVKGKYLRETHNSSVISPSVMANIMHAGAE